MAFRVFLALLLLSGVLVRGNDTTIILGDSLSAEYDTVPAVGGFTEMPTAYAEVTVAGWESRSWVEVLAALRPDHFDFGRERGLYPNWNLPRLSGFEYNWAIPGATAGQYEDFVTATWFSNPTFYYYRQELDAHLEGPAYRVVIWLGANNFRENYGALYDGSSATSLINGLIDDLTRIVKYVKAREPDLQIVIANLPDLGATPSKIASHPDPVKRARVTAATVAANTAIALLAQQKQLALADVYAQSARLVAGETTYFGAVPIIHGQDEDNNPRYHFTRDGLHPNTASQIELARVFIATFNAAYDAGIPQITDAEALDLLGIGFLEPFTHWAETAGLPAGGAGPFDDPDGDGLTNLEEFTFATPPDSAGASNVIFANGVLGFRQSEASVRLVRVEVHHSIDLVQWQDLPPEYLSGDAQGGIQALLPEGDQGFLRLRLELLRPEGS